jgi:hypothetical protein
MAVKYDGSTSGGYTPPKPPTYKPVSFAPPQPPKPPQPVSYTDPRNNPGRWRSSNTPSQTIGPNNLPPKPTYPQTWGDVWNSSNTAYNQLRQLAGLGFKNWLGNAIGSIQYGGTPVSRAQQWNAQQIWQRSRPGPTTGYNATGMRAANNTPRNPYQSGGYNTPWQPNPYLPQYASSGPSQDPRNNPAFWRSGPSANYTTLDLAKLAQIANNPNANNTELRYFYNPGQYTWGSGINAPQQQPANNGGYNGGGWGGWGGGGGGYTPTPYMPQWYMNPGLWRI